MNTRRDFLKKASFLTGTTVASQILPSSILKAMAINAESGSTFYDAEHIVFLMQENRSFDHMLGTLKGVRGFNDPRPHIQPDGNKVWLQKDGTGYTYAPFHVDINKTKITWQGGLPHSWNDQLAARNQGRYDKWIPAKTPMTLGYYNRNDVPFYYALADAFTVCDHNFCSSLTGTTPNRLFFFTGTIRGEKSENRVAVVNNEQAESQNNVFVDWPTFQEVLEDNGVDWRIYQNEVWTAKLPSEIDDWCGNYGDNPLEYIERHRVKLSAYFRKNGDTTVEPALTGEEVTAKYNKLSQREKNLIDKAFTTNISQKDYLELEPFSFKNDKGETETLNIPKGDIFYQFRKDVNEGKLPTVSWLVSPQRFSDHTSSPLYGTWYVSEALDILTKNPEVFKKTVFVLTYDENDGYFDHISPFVVPNPNDLSSGKVSAGIKFETDFEPKKASPIGLGYRVPMVVASPWSKGGFVNSQIFDHTSSLMFLEHFLSKKMGKSIKSNNISDWRRLICGDLTTVFRTANHNKNELKPLDRTEVIESIGNAKNKPAQAGPVALNSTDVNNINQYNAYEKSASPNLAKQELGQKSACALPYHLVVDANLVNGAIEINLSAEKTLFGNILESKGAPFAMSTPKKYKGVNGKYWNYAVKAGDTLKETISIKDFDEQEYDLRILGPNGFYRHFTGKQNQSKKHISVKPQVNGLLSKSFTGNIVVYLENKEEGKALNFQIVDNSYQSRLRTIKVLAKEKSTVILDLAKNDGWYDFSIVELENKNYTNRYAGKVETGYVSKTDPLMAGVI
jgi:phospholipase C